MKVVLDLDDFSDKATCEKELVRLDAYFDSFKINMFTITCETSIETMHKFGKLGCYFYPHGFNHTYLEMDTMSLEQTEKRLFAANHLREKGFFGNVFKAPYWRYSNESYTALHRNGYTIAISREQVSPPPAGYEVYTYDYELDEPWEEYTGSCLTLHGHVTPYRNSLDLWCTKLMAVLPKDTQFLSIDEYLKEVRG